MILWTIFGLMTAAAIAAVLLPLVRRRAEEFSGNDIAVYRDQLGELDRDRAAGLIGKSEAEAARVEISRRLLAAADAAESATVASDPTSAARFRRFIVAAALLLLPAGAGALYVRLGSPELASPPAGDALQSEKQTQIENLVARVEVHLQGNPKDGRGWEILAPVYMQLGRYSDSVNAWRNALALLGESADREANLGEALMAEANGVVTIEAKAAFVRAVTLDNTIVSARYYLGRAAEQDGKREEAAKIWRDLIAEAPAEAHWVNDVRAALARVEASPGAPTSAAPGTQSAAAAKPDQQAVMIRGMVDGLAARLKQDGSDVDGWLKLVRSYKVLGEQDKAQTAISDAQRALANDPDKRKLLDAGLKQLEGSAVAVANSPPQPASPVASPPQHEGDAIQSMVARLAERMKKSSSDPEGWIMLTRSYLSLGEREKAATAIKDARAALADDGPNLQLFNEALQRFKIDETADVASATPASPPAESRAPAQADQQNSEMIRGMVARLADRLKKDGSDLDGWLQLLRSYVVLGERDKAVSAAADARQAIGADVEKRRRLDDFAKSLGLDG
ncbi:MAG: c-type cytochrome biogenesis protein CcmI [Pseudolabrys sp.]